MGDLFNRQQRAKYFAEFIGTMFLVMFVKLGVPSGNPTTALAIGLGLGIWIFNAGHISGGMYNPSVTVAVLVRNIPEFPRCNTGQIAMYFLSQYLGGICGGLFAWMIGGKPSAAVYPTVFQDPMYYDDGARLGQAFAGEFFFTFLLTSTVIHTATDKRASGNQYFGLCIGLTLSVAICCIGNISGCAINSAVWLGAVIPAIATDQIQHNLSDAWIYWIATLLGGAVAGLLFNIFNGPESQLMDEAGQSKKDDNVDVEMGTKVDSASKEKAEARTANISEDNPDQIR
eukprot:227490_1